MEDNIEIFEQVAETPIYRIFWQDEHKTICVIQGLAAKWTWDQAYTAVQHIDAVVRSVPHGVYVIYLFEIGKNMLPHGSGSIIANLRKLMQFYAPNTQLIIFVRPDPALHTFSQIVTRSFKLMGRSYLFVTSMAEAQQIIAEHSQSSAEAR